MSRTLGEVGLKITEATKGRLGTSGESGTGGRRESILPFSVQNREGAKTGSVPG